MTHANYFELGKSQELWKSAKQVIPGGTQLLSKRAEMHLPEYWPAYYNSAKGVKVTDLDNRTYTDMSLMGVGSCVLGYADDDVNQAVENVVRAGNVATLNSPEEVELAKVLLDLHPWAQMARFARTGGEATAIAIRIARAHTGRDTVAFCGYHGWHDWYLSSNLANEANLDGHLLPGLEPAGVPRGLAGTALPFRYNEFEALKTIADARDIGVVIMEVLRHQEPQDGFLENVRAFCSRKNIVLIFDEVSSGFRMCVGGVHKNFGIEPDLCVFGKALSNGYPMAAIIGRRDVMEAAQRTFISSTYWTERTGPTAALATIRKMEKYNIPQHLDEIGRTIGAGWRSLATKHCLPVAVIGPNALITLSFKHQHENLLFTYFVQEMLKRGFLAFPTVYVSYSHTMRDVEEYLHAVDEVFGLIRRALDSPSIEDRLAGPVRHQGFKRLT